MAVRFTDTKLFGYCVSPRTILIDGNPQLVACGKCDGCLLHKANEWSMRLRNEIDDSLVSLWFTLTYSNKYLPTLKFIPLVTDFNQDNFHPFGSFTSDHSRNIRFDGVKDKLRKDDIFIDHSSFVGLKFLPQNYDCFKDFYVGYSSKRDFQLFLKTLRQIINLQFPNYERKKIRYFAVSEYGPTHFRPHIHGLLHFQDYEVASFCKEYALYQAWQMCDKALFDKYTRFCDSGVSGYVTNYVTGFSDLHEFYKNKLIKPFRLSSKGKAIGSNAFDEEEFFECIVTGALYYTKRVERLESVAVCSYPKNYYSSLFPKCFQFSQLSFGRLLEIYGFLFTNVRDGKKSLRFLYKRLSKFRHSSDVQATVKCFKLCEKYRDLGFTPFHYVFLLDLLYYRLAMQSMSYFYKYQISLSSDFIQIIALYDNIVDLLKEFLVTRSERLGFMLSNFLHGFGYDVSDISSDFVDYVRTIQEKNKEAYQEELSEVKKDCVKMPKFNEEFGFAPHIV